MSFSDCRILTGGAESAGFSGFVLSRITLLYAFLVHSALVLSFECVAMAYVSCAIQQVPWDLPLAAIPFLAAFSIYNLNRKTDEAEDAINQKDRFAFTKRYETPLFIGSVGALITALLLAAPFGVMAVLVTAAPFLCGFLYSFRWLPGGFRYRRLKEIPGVKNCVVGIAWGILLSLLPVCYHGGAPGTGTAVTFVLFFLWGFMASLIPDIRDHDGDAASGVVTIPVLLGPGRTKSVLLAVLIALGLPLLLFSLVALPAFTTLILTGAGLWSLMCVLLLEKPAIIGVLADAISDGQYIAVALGIAILPVILP